MKITEKVASELEVGKPYMYSYSEHHWIEYSKESYLVAPQDRSTYFVFSILPEPLLFKGKSNFTAHISHLMKSRS